MSEPSQPYKITRITAAIERAPRAQDPGVQELLEIGLRFHEQGNLPEAELIYREVLRHDFDSADAWHLLGVITHQSGYHEPALELISEAIAIEPLDPRYHNNLGKVCVELGDPDTALRCYERALALQPDYVEAHYNEATTLRDQGRLAEAAEAYRAALRLQPNAPQMLNDLGGTLRRVGDWGGAIECYRMALQLQPENADLRFNLGLVMEEQGRLDEAVDCYREVLKTAPDHLKAHRCVIDLTSKGDAAIAKLEALLDNRCLSEADAETVLWLLGKACEEQGRYKEAFDYFDRANRCQRGRVVFDKQVCDEEVSALIAVYSTELFQQKSEVGHESEVPVFVVGLPRSGKSLTERLLSRHPAICGAGELGFLGRLEVELPHFLRSVDPYPACVWALDAPNGRCLAERYVRRLQAWSRNSLRVINTSPNIMKLGLIALLFPKARIIHCRRDPLDVCLSIYFKSFRTAHAYAYDLNDIGFYHRQYERIIRHWYNLFGHRILPIDYERLASDPDMVARELVDWCGVDAKGVDITQGKAERAHPIQTRFVGRWKNYEGFIGPLRCALEESTE